MGRITDQYGPDDAKISDNINKVIQRWIPKVRTALKSSARQFSDGKNASFVKRSANQIEYKLAASIKHKTREQYGEIYSISFSFEHHGVFVHKGVGRKYPIEGPEPVKNPSGKTRHSVEWFNPVLDRYVPELADKIAEINAYLAVNATHMRIH